MVLTQLTTKLIRLLFPFFTFCIDLSVENSEQRLMKKKKPQYLLQAPLT